jgi:hypothetical protein
MVCEQCGSREAIVHLTRISDGEVVVSHLCVQCRAAVTGESAESRERGLREDAEATRRLQARIRRFEVAPREVRLRVGEELDLWDIHVVARTSWWRRVRVPCELRPDALDPAVMDFAAGGPGARQGARRDRAPGEARAGRPSGRAAMALAPGESRRAGRRDRCGFACVAPEIHRAPQHVDVRACAPHPRSHIGGPVQSPIRRSPP